MGRKIFGWDLPPGVRVSDIPGNRPEDEKWEAILNGFWEKKDRKQDEQLVLDEAAQVYVDLIDEAIEYGIEIGGKQAKEDEEENKYYYSQYKEPFKEKLRLFFKAQRKRIKELEARNEENTE